MFLAAGVGAFTAAIFHVFTHAFFKALLFLGSGSVIHGLHDEQDMRRMGGLKKYLPITFLTMAAGWLAICGIPIFSGFFSKDEILWRTWATEALPAGWGKVLWSIGAITAFLTAVYMTRLMVMTFFGSERFGHERSGHHEEEHGGHHGKPHESPAVMWVPLAALAVLSLVGGLVGVPPALSSLVGIHSENRFEHFLEPAVAKFGEAHTVGQVAVPGEAIQGAGASGVAARPAESAVDSEHHDVGTERLFTGISVVIALLGIGLGFSLYRRQPLREMPSILENKYYVDEFYDATVVNPLASTSRGFLWQIVDVQIIDGIVNGAAGVFRGLGEQMRQTQTGLARSYAAAILAGAIVVIGYFILR
jgi:NADH-quinone oxidoreductase subunit L